MLRSRRTALICFLLAAITLVLYGPALRCDFVNFDDLAYVADNPAINGGLGGSAFAWAFGFHSSNWHPLTWLSHALDCQIFGLRPWGHHLTNVLFHAANTVLLFLVLLQLVNRPSSPAPVTHHASLITFQCAFVAALFAWHPMHVESVAWISERKDVLSTFFFLLTIWSYVRYVECRDPQLSNSQTLKLPNSPGAFSYVLALILFAAALMSKPMVVTLPFLLLLLDFWPLARADLRTKNSVRKILMEKLPFALLAAGACIATVAAQHHQAISGVDILPASYRLKNAVVTYVLYLWKTVWPANLAAFYPFPFDLGSGMVLGAGVLLFLISGLCISQFRTRPYLAVGWLWFAITLVPVIGIVQVGSQAMADRYFYIPSIGLFIAVAWCVPELAQSLARGTRTAQRGAGVTTKALAVSAASVLLALALVTHNQLRYWQNGISLFTRCLHVTRDTVFLEHALAGVYERAGELDVALSHYRRAVEMPPNRLEAPRALQILAKISVAKILQQQAKWPEAIGEFEAVLQTAPARWDLRACLADCLMADKRFDKAAKEYETVLQTDSQNPDTWRRLGIALNSSGQSQDALAAYREAVRLGPYRVEALNDLAWFLATDSHSELRDGTEAIRLAEKACALSGETEPRFFGTFDAALAEAGRFDEAIKMASKTIKLAKESGQTAIAEAAAKRIELYMEHKPCHF